MSSSSPASANLSGPTRTALSRPPAESTPPSPPPYQLFGVDDASNPIPSMPSTTQRLDSGSQTALRSAGTTPSRPSTPQRQDTDAPNILPSAETTPSRLSTPRHQDADTANTPHSGENARRKLFFPLSHILYEVYKPEEEVKPDDGPTQPFRSADSQGSVSAETDDANEHEVSGEELFGFVMA